MFWFEFYGFDEKYDDGEDDEHMKKMNICFFNDKNYL